MIVRVSLLQVLCILITFPLIAKTTTAITNNGNWGSVGTWDNGVPACGDVVVISAGITVRINNTYDLAAGGCAGLSTTVNVYGTIEFRNNPSFPKLACGSIINIYAGGSVTHANSGGNTCQLYICGTLVCQTTGCAAPCSTGAISGPATGIRVSSRVVCHLRYYPLPYGFPSNKGNDLSFRGHRSLRYQRTNNAYCKLCRSSLSQPASHPGNIWTGKGLVVEKWSEQTCYLWKNRNDYSWTLDFLERGPSGKDGASY